MRGENVFLQEEPKIARSTRMTAWRKKFVATAPYLLWFRATVPLLSRTCG